MSGGTEWWRHAVIYEIYVRSFQDSNGDGIGDLKGITQRLDHLQQLGVDALWLTPFFPSPNADFGYDVSDYCDVAPEYGTLADWDELVAEAGRRGMRLLVDFVMNHSSDQHAWFRAARSSREHPMRDWYVWRDGQPDGRPPTNWDSIFGGPAWTYDAPTGQWYYHAFLPEQPDINWHHPALREAMYDVARFWLGRGAAGFRLDATAHLFEDPAWPHDPDPAGGAGVGQKAYNANRPENHAVLRELRQLTDGYDGARVLLGESTIDHLPGLLQAYGAAGDEMQLPMNFMLGRLTQLDAARLKHHLDAAHHEIAGRGHTPVFFFGNHDQHRPWSRFGAAARDDAERDAIARLTSALLLTQPGTVLLYYGEEIGLADLPDSELAAAPLGPQRPRADDRDRCRTPMPWSAGPGAGFSSGTPWLPAGKRAATRHVEQQEAETGSLLHWTRRLLALRRSHPVLRAGRYLPLSSSHPSVLAYAVALPDGQAVLVALNCSAAAVSTRLDGAVALPGCDALLLASDDTVGLLTSAGLKLGAWGVLVASLRQR
ncbi:MAG: hypothetical protein RLZZ584_1750 [Pseudomonadota bacterium]